MEEKIHRITLENRQRAEICACEEVVSLNEGEVVVNVAGGAVVIKGASLKVREVSRESGDAVIEGDVIDSITYTKNPRGKKEGIIGRMLK